MAGYENGRGQRSKRNNSQWLRVLGYRRKTRKMGREAWHKLAQRKAMRDMPGTDNHYLPFLEVFGKPTTVEHRQSAKNDQKSLSLFLPVYSMQRTQM